MPYIEKRPAKNWNTAKKMRWVPSLSISDYSLQIDNLEEKSFLSITSLEQTAKERDMSGVENCAQQEKEFGIQKHLTSKLLIIHSQQVPATVCRLLF